MAVTRTYKLMFKLSLVAFLVFVVSFFANTAEAAPLIRAASNLGLAGYWPMNEGAGIVAGDFSGNGNNGTLTNGPTWAAGKNGKAVQFDGNDDYIDIPNGNGATNLSGATTFTIVAWIKVNAFNDSSGCNIDAIVAKGLDTNPGAYGLSLIDTIECGVSVGTRFPRMFFQTASRQRVIQSSNPIDLGKWYFIVGTHDGATMNLYIDGKLDTSGADTDTIPSNTESVNIGANTMNPGGFLYHLNGVIDDVRIYRRALSASEIAGMYRAGSVVRRTVSNAGLIGYWPLDEGDGAQAGDFSGNGNTGTMNLSTSWTNGRRGGGWLVAEPSHRISVPDSPSLNPTNQITMTAWIYPQNWSGNRRILQKGITDNQYRFTAEAGSFLVEIKPLVAVTTALPPPNTWTHVAVTYNGSAVAIYYNGVLQTSAARSGSLTTSSDPLIIGCKLATSCASSDSFNGTLDDVRLYSRALSVEEIQALAQAGQTRGSRTPTNLVTSGLVGYWPFDGRFMNWTTNQALDASGGGNNGTLSGFSTTTSAVPGRVGQALNFDGSNDFIDAGSAASLDNLGSMSVCAWVNVPSNPSGYPGIVSKSSGGLDGWQFYLYDSGGGSAGLGFYNTDGSAVERATTVPFGSWQHVCGTWDGNAGLTGRKIYLNGVELGSTVLNPYGSGTADGGFNLQIGSLGGGSYLHNGAIDDVRLYERDLTAAEVRQLFQVGR